MQSLLKAFWLLYLTSANLQDPYDSGNSLNTGLQFHQGNIGNGTSQRPLKLKRASSGQNDQSNLKVSDDIADELQRQIDFLRQQIKDIAEKVESTSSEEVLKLLQKQMEDLTFQLQECYKKIDQLSEELQQEFRQKLDELEKEMAQTNKQLNDRLTALEEEFQKLVVNQCIGNLKDGNVETALGTFRSVKKPQLHIKRIISESYRSEKDCGNLVYFLNQIEIEVVFPVPVKNEVRAIGYSTLYEALIHMQFSPEGSDCTYEMAWRADQLKNRLKPDEENAKNLLNGIISKLPKSISHFAISNKNRIKLIVPQEPNFYAYATTCYYDAKGEQGMTKVVSDQVWTPMASFDGVYYMLVDPDSRPLIGDNRYGLNAKLDTKKYTDLYGNAVALWKPIAVSNEQFYLQNKDSNLYLIYRRTRIVEIAAVNVEYWPCNQLELQGFGQDKYLWSVNMD